MTRKQQITKTRKLGSGGARSGAGRKSREELGLPALVNTTVQIEPEIKELARKNHGSLANALRFAAKYRPEDLA